MMILIRKVRVDATSVLALTALFCLGCASGERSSAITTAQPASAAADVPLTTAGVTLATVDAPPTTAEAPPATPEAPPTTVDPISARVDAIATEYLEAYYSKSPEQVTYAGDYDARHDRIEDRSAAAARAWEDKEDRWLAELIAFDDKVPLGHPAWTTYGMLRERLESQVEIRVCQKRLWAVNSLTGWQSSYATLAAQQPVGTAELRAQALARWRGLPRLIDQEIENLREGVTRGYTAPKVNVRRVLTDLDGLLATPPIESPFYSPAARDSTPEFRAEFLRLIESEITPAARRYRDYLADEYLQVARADGSIAANPDGEACYRAAIRRYTTLDRSAAEVHQAGLDALAAAELEFIKVAETAAEELGLTSPTETAFDLSKAKALLRYLYSGRDAFFESREAMSATIDSVLTRAWSAAPDWFTLLPKSELVVEPYPAFREGSAPGQYLLPASDGSRPGVFLVNLSTFSDPGGRFGIERIAIHEAVPGHHLQASLELERPGVHPVTRLIRAAAFSEGWASYAERLADEMGIYSGPKARLYALSSQLNTIGLLVAETGIHGMGWSRADAVRFLLEHSTTSQMGAGSAIDRAMGWPGQGLAYATGYIEIRRLRDLAEATLGPRFDIREFHAQVLESGTIPLPMLSQKIEAWVRDKASQG